MMLPALAAAQIVLTMVYPDWATVPITDHDLGGGVHMIESFGGNVGAVAGPDGLLLIDSEYPELAGRLKPVLARIGSPVKMVIDTHYHWDHVGGNAGFARRGATIVASPETRRHIIEQQRAPDNEPGQYTRDPVALPTVTVARSRVFHVGREIVEVSHLPNDHTDGDLLVRYVHADVVQTGDTYFNGFYPDIDVAHGGSIDGMIAGCDRLVAMAGPRTRIIPGHGPVATRDDVRAFADMLRTVRARVADALARHVTLDALIATHPLDDMDPRWGGNLVKAPYLISIVYDDLSRRR